MASVKLLRLLKELALLDVIELCSSNSKSDAPYIRDYLETLANHIHHVANYVQFEHFKGIKRESAVQVTGDMQSPYLLQVTFRLSPKLLHSAYTSGLHLGELKWSLLFPDMPFYHQGVEPDLLEQVQVEIIKMDKKIDSDQLVDFLEEASMQ